MTDPAVLLTRYFTFGFNHVHAVGGMTFDKDVVVEITAPDPRAVMVETFGRAWGMEYRRLEDVDLRWYPRGVVEIT
jgi:hypothetical protein